MVAQRILVAASLTIGAMAWGQSIEGALRIVCPDGKISRSPGGRAVGCRSCPAGTGLSDVPGIGWDLHRAIMGHFTSAGAQNLVLSGRGCEPHSLHSGGSFIFDVGPRGSSLLKYDPGLITEHCRRLRFKDGRSFLVCRDVDASQGTHWSYVYQVDFGKAGDARTTPIFAIEDSTLTCAEEVRHSTINAILFPDLNRDGFRDVSITATLGTVRLTEAERRECNLGHYAFSRFAIEHQLDFIFDGDRFAVAPSSQATFRLFPKPAMVMR